MSRNLSDAQIVEQCKVESIENVVDNDDLCHSDDDLVLDDEIDKTSIVVVQIA